MTAKVDPRNQLNDLDGRTWLKLTKSFWIYEPTKANHKTNADHYSVKDIEKLILFFTKRSMAVLDSTCHDLLVIQAARCGKQTSLAPREIEAIASQQLIDGLLLDSSLHAKVKWIEKLTSIPDECIDYLLVRPSISFSRTVWNVDPLTDYETYLKRLDQHFKEYFRFLKDNRYLSIIVNDFWSKSTFYPVHMDVAYLAGTHGFRFRGETKLLTSITEGMAVYHILSFDKPIGWKPSVHSPISIIPRIEANRKDFLETTDTAWFSRPPPRDKLKSQHPATYAESDILRILKLATDTGDIIFDPFIGVGSTLLACNSCGRSGLGIELTERWIKIAQKRLELQRQPKQLEVYLGQEESARKLSHRILKGDCREILPELHSNSFDCIITSPPYWGILNKPLDHKTKRERADRGLETRYSQDCKDLANIEKYSDFLEEMRSILQECNRILKPNKYCFIIVTDFRHKDHFIYYQSDMALTGVQAGFEFRSSIALVQDNKRLYPYGYPFSFVSNIHHQTILVFRKPRKD